MGYTQGNTIVQGVEEKMGTYEKRKKSFLVFFTTTYWERVSEIHIGNDIMIETTRPIRNVYLNGKLLTTKENEKN